jgi:PAS domain S-box-containing protein
MADKIRVLYIDDELVLLELGKRFLEKTGEFIVTPVTTVPKAIRLLEQEKFDVIISDFQMPVMNGIAFLQRLKADGDTTPFIIFTGKSRGDVVIEALNAGADFYIQKGGEPKSQFADLSHKIKRAVKHKQANEALIETVRLYRTLAESSPDMIYLTDSTGLIRYVNPQAARAFGCTPSDLIGKQTAHIFPPDVAPHYTEELSIVTTTKVPRHIEVLESFPGGARWISTRLTPILGPAGNVIQILGISTDVTDRKQAEEALAHQSARFAILNEIILMANRADDLEQLLQTILSESLRLLDFDAGGIYLVDHATRMAHVVHTEMLSPALVAEIASVPIDKAPYDTLFIRNEPIFTDNYAEIAPQRAEAYGFRSMASIPLIVDGVAIGAINFVSKKKYQITDLEKQTLTSIGRELGSSIVRMRGKTDAQRAQKNFETLFDSIDEMIFVLDQQGRILAHNRAVETHLLYAPKELIGTEVLDLHVPEQREEASRRFQGILTGTCTSCPVPVRAKDGRQIDVETTVIHGQWNGNAVLIGVTRDVTRRTLAEESLKKAKEHLALAIDGSGVGLWDWYIQTGMLTLNDRWAEIIGYTLAELAPVSIETWTRLCHPDDLVQSNELLKAHFAQQACAYECEARMRHKDGHWVWVLDRGKVAEWDRDGRPVRMTGTHLDITERKQNEDALRLANRQLNLVSSITRHDINNQIFALRSYIELSHDVINNPQKIEEYIQKMEQAAEAIEHQISFTKDYQELGAATPVWQNVNAVIKKAVGSLPVGEIRIEPDPDNPSVLADSLFGKVFYNLIDNALRYGGDRMTKITVLSQEHESGLLIICEDDGVGISVDDKRCLFTRGFGKHTGLGLFLSREILAITGITITENGEPGKGARFEIIVPKGMWRKMSRRE